MNVEKISNTENISEGEILIGRVHGTKKNFWVKISGSKSKIQIKRKNISGEQLRTWRKDKILVAIKILSAKKLIGEIVSTVDG